MAQYFQVVNQSEKVIDDDVNLYANSNQNVQYVIRQDDQIQQGQPIIVSGEQYVVLDNGNQFQNQPIILDGNEYQDQVQSSQGQQVYFMEGNNQLLSVEPPPPVVLNHHLLPTGKPTINPLPKMAASQPTTPMVRQRPSQSLMLPQGLPRYQYRVGSPILQPGIQLANKDATKQSPIRAITPIATSNQMFANDVAVPPLNRIGQVTSSRGTMQPRARAGIAPRLGQAGPRLLGNIPKPEVMATHNGRGNMVPRANFAPMRGNSNPRSNVFPMQMPRGAVMSPVLARGGPNMPYTNRPGMGAAAGFGRGGIVQPIRAPNAPMVRPRAGRGNYRGNNKGVAVGTTKPIDLEIVDDDDANELLVNGSVINFADYKNVYSGISPQESSSDNIETKTHINKQSKAPVRGGGRGNRGRGGINSPQGHNLPNAMLQQPPVQQQPNLPQYQAGGGGNQFIGGSEANKFSTIQCTAKPSLFKNFVPPPEIKDIISNTPLTPEFQNSVRMFVLLANGEQRLITFTVPKEDCTIHEILDQVGVEFQPDTEITCTETNADGINYVVTVGMSQAALSEYMDIPQASQPPPTQPPPTQPPPIQPPKIAKPPKIPTPELIPLSEPEVPKYVKGMVAVCNYCGFLSDDFNTCLRCKHKLPEHIKAMPTAAGKLELAKQMLELKKPTIAIHLKNNGIPKQLAKKKPIKSRVIDEEPVILTLSSDEEDIDEEDRLNKTAMQDIINNAESPPANLLQKEPTKKDIENNSINSKERDEIAVNINTTIYCRTIRIGSYRFTPIENVKLTNRELTIKVPSPQNANEIKTIKVDRKCIVKVLINFHKLLPVIFYYVTPEVGEIVRKELGMVSGNEVYFDPLSEEEAFKRITLLPEIFTEELKAVFKTMYGPPTNIMDELNTKEANNILIRTCPKEVVKAAVQAPPVLISETSLCTVKQILIYPPGTGGISINTEDYLCLAQDQFLNDVIIDFYLKHLVLQMPQQQKDKVHVFSTFFYKRLTTKPPKPTRKSHPAELDPNLTPAQKRHFRVKNWTKNVNLFEKDYVVVPINENAHWFLAIICFPGMDGPQTPEGTPCQAEPLEKKKKIVAVAHIGSVTITQIKVEKSLEDGDISDKDEAEGDDSELDSSEETTVEEEKEEKVVAPVLPQIRPPIKQPCILIFDSLAGTSRARVVATLRDYLTCEHGIKQNTGRVFNKDIIKGACPKVPQQTNYTDCGLYLLQYVESFFQVPIKDYHIPINELKSWFDELTVTKKREDISILIKKLMRQYDKDTDILPNILFPTLNGELVERNLEEDEDAFEDDEEIEEEDMMESEDGEITNNKVESGTETESEMETVIQLPNLEEGEISGAEQSPSITHNSAFIEQDVDSSLKPDFKEQDIPKNSNRDTMSYLKAKRIVRHKLGDGVDPKRYKPSPE